MCTKMFDELNPHFDFLPKLQMPVDTCGNDKISSAGEQVKRCDILCNYDVHNHIAMHVALLIHIARRQLLQIQLFMWQHYNSQILQLIKAPLRARFFGCSSAGSSAAGGIGPISIRHLTKSGITIFLHFVKLNADRVRQKVYFEERKQENNRSQ